MDVNSVWNSSTYQQYYNQANNSTNSAATTPNFAANSNQNIFTAGQSTDSTIETKNNKSKAGIFAAVGAVAALGIATFAAYKTGKTKAGDNAKFGEILKTGFSEIGKKISNGFKKLFGGDGAQAAGQVGGQTTKTVTRELTEAEKQVKSVTDHIRQLAEKGDIDTAKSELRQAFKDWHPDLHPDNKQAGEVTRVLTSLKGELGL